MQRELRDTQQASAELTDAEVRLNAVALLHQFATHAVHSRTTQAFATAFTLEASLLNGNVLQMRFGVSDDIVLVAARSDPLSGSVTDNRKMRNVSECFA